MPAPRDCARDSGWNPDRAPDPEQEWLEADGAGGFASGTAALVRTRRYHALLLAAAPEGRFVLANGIEAWVETASGQAFITAQAYQGGVIHPDGERLLAGFTHEPFPTWRFRLPGGGTLVQELLVERGQTMLLWRLQDAPGPARLHVRLLLSGRDYHALHHENPSFAATPAPCHGGRVWYPYPGVPPIAAHGGAWRPDPVWYRRFFYRAEEERGLDCTEDLLSPGVLDWPLDRPAALVLRADTLPPAEPLALAEAARTARQARPPLDRAATQYLIERAGGPTIIAGYPWFTDWGRDSFIALRGLLLATGRVAEAERLLLRWAACLDGGMLPNRFPDGGAPPEFNAVDASLWFVIAVHDLIAAGGTPEGVGRLQATCTAILAAYAAGTRYGIRADADGLLQAGMRGVQLTWMDAKVGDWVVTPRIGKPVEVQALWINALRIAGGWPGGARWIGLAARAGAAFYRRFPDPRTGGLFDVLDGDPTEQRQIRPNQIFAVGGLPHQIVPMAQARAIVDLVESRLLTPLGLRTLDPDDPDYRGRYCGDVRARDGAYHQGTAWPWLLGPFVEAWLRVRGDTGAARAEAAARFLPPLRAHLAEAGLGHVSEVADGDPPHRPGGCPFQAWSLGEMLRIGRLTGARPADPAAGAA